MNRNFGIIVGIFLILGVVFFVLFVTTSQDLSKTEDNLDAVQGTGTAQLEFSVAQAATVEQESGATATQAANIQATATESQLSAQATRSQLEQQLATTEGEMVAFGSTATQNIQQGATQAANIQASATESQLNAQATRSMLEQQLATSQNELAASQIGASTQAAFATQSASEAEQIQSDLLATQTVLANELQDAHEAIVKFQAALGASQATPTTVPVNEVATQAPPPQENILDTAEAIGLTTLVTAMGQARTTRSLLEDDPGPFTLFASTNDAIFEAIVNFGVAPTDIIGNSELIASILSYHVVRGQLLAADLATMDGEQIETLNGEKLTISVNGGKVYVDDIEITLTDVLASNGVIHVINGWMIPPSAQEIIDAMKDD